ncbi:MAG: hypothetical protein QM758_27215 [Armatimonas sp.]
MKSLVLALPLTLLLISLLSGCRPSGRDGSGRFARPADGTVHVLYTRLSSEHIKWSIIGERNWIEPQAQGSSLALRDVYPLNTVDRQGGCFTWEIDLILEKDQWRTRLHGSNGKTAESNGPRKGDLSLRIDRDTDLRLPADTVLANVGDTPIRLSIAR